MKFFDTELRHQLAWRETTAALRDDERISARGPRFVKPDYSNLWPPLRETFERYVAAKGLKLHRDFAHLLSSQTSCFNFLGPFMSRPAALADLLRPVLRAELLPIWLPGEESFVAFEFISGPDYLKESGPASSRQRGAQCTSVDAAVGFVRDGRRELLLIEWKYTERHGQPLTNKPRSGADGLKSSNDVRRARYQAVFDEGVVQRGLALDDFFWEPFYQLLRQQMLAWKIEKDDRDPESAFERATLAHISPKANDALKKVTSPALLSAIGEETACEGWTRLLRQPDRYIAVSVETLFRAFPFEKHPDLIGWRDYMSTRYAFLNPPDVS